MYEQDCFNQIESNIKALEIKKKVRSYKDNSDTLNTYWNIGKLLIEVQGRAGRTNYGNELIRNWSKVLCEKYGRGYDYTNLQRFKRFYIEFPIVDTLCQQFINWSHIRYILPIKDENERNYYINLVIEKDLSARDLIKEIKSNSYNRLLNKPDHVDIINTNQLLPNDKIKNPIIININKGDKVINEYELENLIVSQYSYFLNQLGDNYLLKDNQYKILIDGYYRYIDILLFNLDLNCYTVVELKLRKLNEKDVGQTKLYMDAIDKKLKRYNQNSTQGIIITKEDNKLVANFIRNNDLNIIPVKYELRELFKQNL